MVDHFKKHLYWVSLFFAAIYFMLIINLFCLHLKKRHLFFFFDISLPNSIHQASAQRGLILDRHGTIIAMNVPFMSAFINPTFLEKPTETMNFLAAYFPDAYDRLSTHQHKQFMYVGRRLTTEQHALILSAGLSDIKLVEQMGRYYPFQVTSTVVGITGFDNEGLCGIEYQEEQLLRSSDNKKNVGKNIQLTIDAQLQFLVQEELENCIATFKAKEGSVIIMDPDTGDILALVNVPSFDPNNMTDVHPSLLNNKAVSDSYEPGSVMKIFAALAALEEGMVTLDEMIDCKNSKTALIDGRMVNTWRSEGIIPFLQVIAYSNNIGSALVAKRLGTNLYDHYMRVGFGKKTGIDFPGEHPGFVNPPELWSKQSIYSLSYGYEILVTPLQLASAFSLLARGGSWITPRLIQTSHHDNHENGEQLYKPATIAAIHKILEYTTTRHTARPAQLAGFTLKGKTGSANMLDETKTYKPGKNIFTYAGIVEKDAYKRVIVVRIKETERTDLFASMVATPLFDRIAGVMVINDRAW